MGINSKEGEAPLDFTQALTTKISPIEEGMYLSMLLNNLGLEGSFTEQIDKMVARKKVQS